ncbi:MAG TPA: RidA family protein [Candidatus Binatia bacterium]|jgi:enamine deaminase RidA (YjgF/YER057c/UK114 family)
MAIKRLHKNKLYSEAVIDGKVVYLSGQGVMGGSIAHQTRATLKNIDALLKEAGTNKSKLVSAMIWLSDVRNYDEVNKVWEKWIDPKNPPARACVEAKLAFPQVAIEIMVVAALK